MIQWKMECIWSVPERKVETLINPSWEEIQSILIQIDGYHLDNVWLLGDFECFAVAGGNEFEEWNGKRVYQVSYFDENQGQTLLVNPTVSQKEEEYLQISVEGVGTDCERKYLVEYDAMIKAFQHFYETGKLTEDQEWEVW